MTPERDYYDSGGLSAVFYDLICGVDPTNKGDADFYQGLVRPGGSVLDFGCGTGRIAFELACRGHQVVGVDLAQTMIYRAAHRLPQLPEDAQTRVRLVQGDMAEVSLGKVFDLVIASYFSLGHVPPDRWGAVFRNIERHMAEGAKAAVHLPVARLMAVPPPKGPSEPVMTIQYTQGGDKLALHVVSQTFEPGGRFEQILDYVMLDGDGSEVRRSRERLVYFDEDPLPHASAAGLAAVGSPIDLGVGAAFVFERSPSL